MKLLKFKFSSIILVFEVVTANYTIDNHIQDSSSFNKTFDGYNVGSDVVSDGPKDNFMFGEFDRNNGSYPSKAKIKLQGDCNSCGIAYGDGESGRVVNGNPVTPEYKYPWIVRLIKDNMIACGGTLISATYVMTAGHCVFNSQMSEYPECQQHGVASFCYFSPSQFTIGILSADQQTASESLAVQRIIGHPEYYHPELMHDIALMQLASPVRCSATTMPVCLPPRDFQRVGTTLITAGYGWNTPEGQDGPQILREGRVKEVDPTRCLRPTQPSDYYNFLVCGSGEETEQSSCYGDSGSSVFGYFGNKYYAVGVVSYGSSPECTGQNPVAYHRVYAAMNFIKENVRDLPQS